MLSTGQRCTATSRTIIVNDISDEMAERLVEASLAFRVGDPLDERTGLGPLASAAQYRTVTKDFETAAAKGLEGGTLTNHTATLLIALEHAPQDVQRPHPVGVHFGDEPVPLAGVQRLDDTVMRLDGPLTFGR